MHNLTFYRHKQPSLPDGLYTVEVTHKVKHKGKENRTIPETTFTRKQQIYISGERFSLQPEEVLATYPPENGFGDFAHVIPHVQLSRDTLPWEREGQNGDDDSPWLALLIFTEEEAPALKTLTLEDLQKAGQGFPSFSLEPGQKSSDQVQVIEVQKTWAQTFMPDLATLKLLSHVRYEAAAKRNSDDANGGLAAILANRLPTSQRRHLAYLVSVENRYEQGVFAIQKDANGDTVRFVVLKSWQFNCSDEAHSLRALLENANLDQMSMPEVGIPEVWHSYCKDGYVPLPWRLRNGKKGMAWYRGPLISLPSPRTEENFEALKTADQFLVWGVFQGAWEASYAAAWEWGRKLAFKQQAFALALTRWMRQVARTNKQTSPKLDLPYAKTTLPSEALKAECMAWLLNLKTLPDLPLAYLVPHEALLPLESIKFVNMDLQWLKAALSGALSLGATDPLTDYKVINHFAAEVFAQLKPVSGCIIRSQLVKDFPTVAITAKDANGQPLEMIAQKKYGSNLMICLFEGELAEVDFLQQGETLHFGLDSRIKPNGETEYYTTYLANGRAAGEKEVPIHLMTGRRIDLSQLAKDLSPNANSAHIGFALTEANSGLRFLRDP